MEYVNYHWLSYEFVKNEEEMMEKDVKLGTVLRFNNALAKKGDRPEQGVMEIDNIYTNYTPLP